MLTLDQAAERLATRTLRYLATQPPARRAAILRRLEVLAKEARRRLRARAARCLREAGDRLCRRRPRRS